jgi:hypothetical protein
VDLDREQGCRQFWFVSTRTALLIAGRSVAGGLLVGKCPFVLIALRSCRLSASIALVTGMTSGRSRLAVGPRF